MDSINTRRWPRYHVHLPVRIAMNPSADALIVPGLVCELSRSGMEIYGGVNLQPGERMEVEFQTSGSLHVMGVVRNRSGFCFGLEFCEVWKDPEEEVDELVSLIHARHEEYLKQRQQSISKSLQTLLEIRKNRQNIEGFGRAIEEWHKTRQRRYSAVRRPNF